MEFITFNMLNKITSDKRALILGKHVSVLAIEGKAIQISWIIWFYLQNPIFVLNFYCESADNKLSNKY